MFLQPSDAAEGNQLEVEISGASLVGTPKLKVFLFGKVLGGSFIQEVLEFDNNGSKTTRNYYVLGRLYDPRLPGQHQYAHRWRWM